METESTPLVCYNRGCGQKFNPLENPKDACRHHPGLPFFHDAYKGWSCCNKKCTDFTEFLNIKGCSYSSHSNVKPAEPEKPVVKEMEKEIVEVKPMVPVKIKRPPIDTPMTTMKPEIAQSLKQALNNVVEQQPVNISDNSESIPIGTSCKNKGCSVSYEGEQSQTTCMYHSGQPIFHEGLKYWSCCQKKTTDFNAFLNQIGCERGKHVWIEEENNDKAIECRWDWHQTGSHIVISVYAKEYCPNISIIQINPIRLFIDLVFPKQSNASFTLDIELQRVIDVRASQVSMYGTKVEIKLKKAEPGSWTKLETAIAVKPATTTAKKVETLTPKIDAVDLSDL